VEYLRQRFHEFLSDNWPVRVSEFTWETSEVFKSMAGHDYEASFVEWHQAERQRSKERAREFLDETGCKERFLALLERHRNGNVVPFVGAGLSIPSGFQGWGDFLTSLLADAPHAMEEVTSLIADGKYEEAAQIAHDQLGADAFSEEIGNRLGPHHRKVAGPVSLMPEVFNAEVVTTNFDYVLTKAYEQLGRRFDREICGAALRGAPARLGTERHCLLRLHGEAIEADGRVLTKQEYDATYTGQRTMAELFRELVGIRSFLFLGCSLREDRTIAALRDVKAAAPAGRPPHYAILPAPNANERNQRRHQLAEAGIHPIYYPPNDHDQCIEDLLICLAEGELDD